MNRIEFGEFRATDEIRKNVSETLDSGWITAGKKVLLFEENFRNLFGYRYSRLVSSGTAADTICCMSLLELMASPGDEVIVPALSFIASATSIRAAGLIPVFVDVRKETLGINETLIEAAITPKTRAIMAVNLMGRPVELDVIQDIARRHSLYVIIDNCEAYGSKFKGEFSLKYGDFETTSHFSAHLSVIGEGGTVSTNRDELDDLVQSVRSHGRPVGSNYFDHQLWGLNFKNTDIAASIGLSQLGNEFWLNFRERSNNLWTMRDACLEFSDKAWFIERDNDRCIAPHAFSVTVKPEYPHINKLKVLLDKRNIAWKINFGSMADHGCFNYLGQAGKFENATYIGENGLHIGVHRYLTNNDISRICQTLRDFFTSY